MEINAFLRSMLSTVEDLGVMSGTSKEYATTATGVVVDITDISHTEAELASASLRERAQSVINPEELTFRGREEWARERGY